MPLIAEADIVRQFRADSALDLSAQAADGPLAGAAWPSHSLWRECSGTSHTFPDVTRVNSGTLAELTQAQGSTTPTERLRALVRSFPLVSLPECYPRRSLLPARGTMAT